MTDQMAPTDGSEPKSSPSKRSPSHSPTSLAGVSGDAMTGIIPATHESLLVAEGGYDDDADSALGDNDYASSTHSMSSDIMRYRVENGRTYHSYKQHVNYVLPNDAPEQDRLDMQHHLFQLTFDGPIYLCPAGRYTPVRRCLDAGTGTGVWALDFADDNPESEVVGIDLSPIQPKFVPPNLYFQIDDLEEDWSFEQPFDFIFSRMMTGSIGDWPRFFQQSFENLRPEGWIEIQDIGFPVQCDDGTLAEESHLSLWSSYMIQATEALGRSARGPVRYKSQLIAAGFQNVTEVVYKWPMNRWPAHPHYKNLGFWCYQNIAGGLSGLSMALFTRGLGWRSADVEVFMIKVREEMKNHEVHAWWPIHVVYGQKPQGSYEDE